MSVSVHNAICAAQNTDTSPTALSVTKGAPQLELSMSFPLHKPDCAAQNSDKQLSAGEARCNPLPRELSRALDTVKNSRTEVEYQAMAREKELVVEMCDMLRNQLREKDEGHALSMKHQQLLHEKEMAELRTKVQQHEQAPTRQGKGESRAKTPGDGRSSGLTKATKIDVKDIVYQKVHFFQRAGAGRNDFRDTLAEMYEKENNLYWDEDKANCKQQAGYKANWAIDVLCVPNEKFTYGNVGEMLEYMLGTKDIGEDGDGYGSREEQIAKWFYPTTDYADSEYVQNQMTKCMTGLNAMNRFFHEYYKKQAYFPPGWQEGMPIPPSPKERREAKKRRRDEPKEKRPRGRPKKEPRVGSGDEE